MDWKDKKVLVFGSGKSGTGACELLIKEGARPVIYDGNGELSKQEILNKLSEPQRAEVVLGEFPEEMIRELSLVIMSPGVPCDLPVVRKFKDSGLPVWGEKPPPRPFSDRS